MRRSLPFLFALLCLVLVSCATSPVAITDPSGVDLKLSWMDTHEVKKGFGIGTESNPNPYLPPKGIGLGPLKDFIVLRLGVFCAQPTSVEILSLDAFSPEGAILASFKEQNEFMDVWRGYEQDALVTKRRIEQIDRSYFPGWKVQQKKGSRNYVLVLVGDKRISLPVVVKARIAVDGNERSFEIPVEKR